MQHYYLVNGQNQSWSSWGFSDGYRPHLLLPLLNPGASLIWQSTTCCPVTTLLLLKSWVAIILSYVWKLVKFFDLQSTLHRARSTIPGDWLVQRHTQCNPCLPPETNTNCGWSWGTAKLPLNPGCPVLFEKPPYSFLSSLCQDIWERPFILRSLPL